MKTMIEVPDEILDAARTEAEQRGTTLKDFISEALKVRVDMLRASAPATQNVRATLIKALSQGKNTKPIGPLRREELHERPVLH